MFPPTPTPIPHEALIQILPPASLWSQVPVVGVFALLILVFAFVARIAWKEFVKWQAEQEEARRLWQADQEEKQEKARIARDESWQSFFQNINQGNTNAIGNLTKVTERLVDQINAVMNQLIAHDSFTRDLAERERRVTSEPPKVSRRKKTL
jgi:hypothetical protein